MANDDDSDNSSGQVEIVLSDDDGKLPGENTKAKLRNDKKEVIDFKFVDPVQIHLRSTDKIEKVLKGFGNYKAAASQIGNKIFGSTKVKAFKYFNFAVPHTDTEKSVEKMYDKFAKTFGTVQACIHVMNVKHDFFIYSKEIDQLIVHCNCKYFCKYI